MIFPWTGIPGVSVLFPWTASKRAPHRVVSFGCHMQGVCMVMNCKQRWLLTLESRIVFVCLFMAKTSNSLCKRHLSRSQESTEKSFKKLKTGEEENWHTSDRKWFQGEDGASVGNFERACSSSVLLFRLGRSRLWFSASHFGSCFFGGGGKYRFYD